MPTTTDIVPSREAREQAKRAIVKIAGDRVASLGEVEDLFKLRDELALAFHWSRVGPGLLEKMMNIVQIHDRASVHDVPSHFEIIGNIARDAISTTKGEQA